MKIVEILYNPWEGGAEEVSYLLAKEAIKDGQEVEFIFGQEGPFVQRVKDLGCRVHFVKMHSPFDPFAIWNLRKIFKEIKPDIVHTMFLRENFLAIVASKLTGIGRVVSTVHRIEPKTKTQAFFNRMYSRGLSAFIATSKVAEKYLTEEGIKKEKLKVVYNGIELPNIKNISKKSPVFTVGFVGRVSSVKNIPLLFEALKNVDKNNLEVMIVGDGPEREKLEEQAKGLKLEKVVSFKGYSKNPSVFYKEFDVFVLPSKIEVFPMALLEAMSYGVPAVASNVGGIPEIVKDGENGMLFTSGNVEELAEKLEKIRNEKHTKERLSENALKSVRQFSAEKMYKETKKIYLEALG